MRRTARAWWSIATLALFAAACDRPHPIEARPALWRLRDVDTTIWLLGSIHALPPGVMWRTPAIARAIDSADTLILEVAPVSPAAARNAFLAAASRPGLPPILERVPADRRDALARGIEAASLKVATLDRMTNWGAALAITTGAAGRSGAGEGVETLLARRFEGARKAIGALETREGQFALFDRLPEGSQRRLLLSAAADAMHPDIGYRRLLAAWTAGDERALAATIAPLRTDPAIDDALISARNQRWAVVIERRMTRPGRVMIAVGVGHLVGPGSVVALLRADGYRVERVE